MFESSPFRHHGVVRLTQSCVCFTNLCINLLVPLSVTHVYCTKVLELLHLLLIRSMHPAWVSGEMYSNTFWLVLIFILTWSHAAENRSSVWVEHTVKEDASSNILSAKSRQLSCSSNSDNFVNLTVTVYSIHTKYGVVTAHILVKSNTQCEGLWYSYADTDTNFWAGIQWFHGQKQDGQHCILATLPKAFHEEPGHVLLRSTKHA